MSSDHNRGGHRWQKGEVTNPTGRKKGEIFVSEAVRMLLRGDAPTSDAPVWTVARRILEALTSERIDSRTLALVLDRLEGKVPDRLEVQGRGQVVLLPAGQLAGQAWIDAVRSETGVELPPLPPGPVVEEPDPVPD